jgi:hypothetical protein
LVSADAAWCGQCFAPLPGPGAATEGVPEPETVTVPGATDPGGATERATTTTKASTEPTWPCPVCDTLNPIELDACGVCGTSFAALMKQIEAPASVSPDEAMRWSLIFPGLGHRKVGRSLDGLTRGILFALLGGMALLIALGGLHSSVLIGLFALYLAFAVAVYVGSAVEARHLAEGGGLLLPTRQILWAGVIVVMASLGLLVVSVITATKR